MNKVCRGCQKGLLSGGKNPLHFNKVKIHYLQRGWERREKFRNSSVATGWTRVDMSSLVFPDVDFLISRNPLKNLISVQEKRPP